MTSHESLLTPAIEAVRNACQIARTVQRDIEGIRQITKDDRSPVTVADFAVQAMIAMALRDAFGEVAMVGEESAGVLRSDEQSQVRQAVVDAVSTCRPGVTEDEVLDAIDLGGHDGAAEAYWTLDPIDGTKGFIRGQQYAIALGRIEDGRVVLGVMGCPNLPLDRSKGFEQADPQGAIYTAIAGQGAWEYSPSSADAHATRIHAATEMPAAGMRVCESVEKEHTKQSDTQRIVDLLGGAGEPVRLDSQCKYAVVARGQADAYLRMPTSHEYVEKIWDHAAGSLIATESGAIVTDITGNELDFSHGKRLEANRGVICAAEHLHERIINAIEELGIGAAV